MGEFTHFNEQGHAVMVDVSEKSDTVREATAMGRILSLIHIYSAKSMLSKFETRHTPQTVKF